MATSKLQAFLNHPAGPKTISFMNDFSINEQLPGTFFQEPDVHFWAPAFKWGISIANVADFAKPPEKISYPQQIAVTCTGLIWSRYSLVITPLLLVGHPFAIGLTFFIFDPGPQKNWNLFSVNVAMAGTGIYQLTRKLQHDYSAEAETAVAKE